MEKFIYDDAIDDVLEIIDSRLEYYDCLVIADKAGERQTEAPHSGLPPFFRTFSWILEKHP